MEIDSHLQTVKLDLYPIQSLSDIPTGIAVHGTNAAAWDIISMSFVFSSMTQIS